MLSAATIARLKEAAGPKGWTEDPAEIAPHLREWRDKFQGATPLMLKPDTVAQVSALVAICAETRTPLVPQGGNTGLAGGQIPHGQVLLSLTRLNRVRALDTADNTLTCEAGVTLAAAQAHAAEADRLFPLSLASEGSATIGGVVSTNAGGTAVLRYGNARDLVLGLEAVLPDGRVWNGLRALRKDNTGYDLKQLFIGAEGTLGVVTAAVLKLYPAVKTAATAIAAVPDPAAAVSLLHVMQAASGGAISAFEIMPRIGIDFVTRHMPGARDPLAVAHPWYVLIEATSAAADAPLRTMLETALTQAMESRRVRDAVIAESDAQSAQFWRLREAMSEAQKYEGGSIKHDVSVPVSRMADFIAAAEAAVTRACPGVRVVAFGHIGDGNVHFNLSQPLDADKAAFLARWEELNSVVHGIAHQMGGSISAEHGLGRLKRDAILAYKSDVEMDLMRTVKRALDPFNIMNPGAVVGPA